MISSVTVRGKIRPTLTLPPFPCRLCNAHWGGRVSPCATTERRLGTNNRQTLSPTTPVKQRRFSPLTRMLIRVRIWGNFSYFSKTETLLSGHTNSRLLFVSSFLYHREQWRTNLHFPLSQKRVVWRCKFSTLGTGMSFAMSLFFQLRFRANCTK